MTFACKKDKGQFFRLLITDIRLALLSTKFLLSIFVFFFFYSAYDNLKILSNIKSRHTREELYKTLKTVGLDPVSKKLLASFL